MKFTNRVVVTGMKRGKGDFEGVAYDSTKFFIQTELDASKGNARGVCTTEYTLGLSSEYEKFENIPLPFQADAEMEISSSGRGQKILLVSLRPVSTATERKAA